MSQAARQLPRVLLFEQHFVMRRTIVSVARDLGVAEVADASTIARTRALLAAAPYEGIVLDLDEAGPTLELLGELRLGRFRSRADAPVVVIAAALRPADEKQLETLKVTQVLRKPFKIGELLGVVAGRRPAATSAQVTR